MDHICIEEKKGQDFFVHLRGLYKKRRGWKWYLSLKTCKKIKLVKLIRMFEDEDWVDCSDNAEPRDRLPDLGNPLNPYKYTKRLSEVEHLRWVEKALAVYFHGHLKHKCPKALDRVIRGVPHRNGYLEAREQAIGYGAYAEQCWDLQSAAAALAIAEGIALAFAGVWLRYHRYDLQTAAVPLVCVATVVAGFLALLEVSTS
ncbi:MAG: hypothetical protein M1814_000972 [Vezdaea aestivalis]|nr:MAG: hypothetical protein M1814_000972 [Vezdaea aestivalis]